MLMRFDPLAEMDRFSRQVWGGNRYSQMPVDAYRKDDRFWLHLDIPGVDQDSIDITTEKNMLTVSATREWKPEEGTQVVLNERPTGSFSRQFFLGDGLDLGRIEAGYDHGVLTVSIPIAETAKPRKITVGTVHEAIGS
jgi:HSP20 family protein